MVRISRSSCVVAVTALVATLLLGACPPAGESGSSDTTGAGSGDRIRYPLALASIPILREAANPERRRDCFTRKFTRGNSTGLPGGDSVTMLAHDSTVRYELASLEAGEHYIAIMIDEAGTGLEDYALAAGDTSCWAVRADSVGVHSVFYGRDETVLRPLTIERHSRPHGHAEADWIAERRYPAQFRRFDSTSVRPAASSWLPSFLAPGVAFASTVALAEPPDGSGSGPWTTCIRYGCCKPR